MPPSDTKLNVAKFLVYGFMLSLTFSLSFFSEHEFSGPAILCGEYEVLKKSNKLPLYYNINGLFSLRFSLFHI